MELTVNGSVLHADLDPAARLVDVLRSRGLTGTKDACSMGACGACTVLVDGRPVLACLTLAARVRGEVVTVEGLAAQTGDLRAAFADQGGLQCGYCTSGQIVTACALVAAAERPGPLALDGNLCRCRGSSPVAGLVGEIVNQ